MGKKKNLYSEFCKKSNLIKEGILSKNIQNVIELLEKEDIDEKIKLLKFSAKKIFGKQNFKIILQIVQSNQYPIGTWEDFEFYFRLRNSLERKYYYELNNLRKLNSVTLFSELNKILIKDGERPQDIIDFVNEIYNYKGIGLSKLKKVIYKIKNLSKSKQRQIINCFGCYKGEKTTRYLLQLFEYDFIDFKYVDKHNVYVVNNARYDLEAITVADLDNEVVLQWQNMIFHLNLEKNLFHLTPKEYLSIIEENLLKDFELNKFLFSAQQIHGIPIKYWLKTFLLIYKENWNCLQSRENLLCKKSKEEWGKLFSEGGINIKYQSDIFNVISFFKYQCSKRDIHKHPFLIDDNDIYTIPGIVCSLNITRVLISIFEDLENNLQFKGEYYEKFIRSKWSQNDIKNIKKKEKISGEEYDCDMAFLFNDDLYICEIKNLLQPNSLQEWHKFYIKTQDNLQQLERIVNHYSEQNYLKNMVKELSGVQGWLPNKIHSLLLYSCYIGTTIRNKDIWIASEIDVYNFFARTPLVQLEVFEDRKEVNYSFKYLQDYEYLENKSHMLTTSDFERYIQCPMAIKYQKNRVSWRKKKISLLGVLLWIDCIEINKSLI